MALVLRPDDPEVDEVLTRTMRLYAANRGGLETMNAEVDQFTRFLLVADPEQIVRRVGFLLHLTAMVGAAYAATVAELHDDPAYDEGAVLQRFEREIRAMLAGEDPSSPS